MACGPVTLIIPPSIFLLDERVFMPLGILRIAAQLELEGVETRVLDLSGVTNFEEVVSNYSRGTDSLVYGISSTTQQFPAAARIARVIRQNRPGARLILGGPHATLVAASCRKNVRARWHLKQIERFFDTAVQGDGEMVIGGLLESGPRWVNADDPSLPGFIPRSRIDQFPFPARHLVDVHSYRFFVDDKRALSLVAQYGCPFACAFCAGRSSSSLRIARFRSVTEVLREVRELYETYGTEGFMFYDDELNVSPSLPDLLRGLVVLQRELGARFRMRGCVKAELFTREQADLMAAAGFHQLLVGFESGSPRVLLNINKKATRADNNRCVQLARSAGILVKGLMSIGHPGESPETLEETVAWLVEARPDDFNCTIITCTPGAPYYDMARPVDLGKWEYRAPATGDVLYSEDINYAEVADYYNGAPGSYKSYVSTRYLNPDELVTARDRIERTVRKTLDIPYPSALAATVYDQSMGQSLPPWILRSSSG